jgi:hypothetical protein
MWGRALREMARFFNQFAVINFISLPTKVESLIDHFEQQFSKDLKQVDLM